MTCDCDSTQGQMCDCCAGVTQQTPVAVVNRPALPSVSYRVGSYGTFLTSMQAALSSSEFPALAGLRTRDSGDFSVALIDTWAEVLDILTFYSERLANEAYLGTAIEARSVFELARLVGYKPSPGVSATTVLAFTLAAATGSPATVPIPAGTRVQSVPGPNQSPQVFETSAALSATIANNAIPASTANPWRLLGGETSTWIAGTSTGVQVGNALLFVSAPNGVPSLTGPSSVAFVTAVSLSASSGNTMISWDNPLPTTFTGTPASVCLYFFRSKAALFGVNAPRPGMFVRATLENIPPHIGKAFPANHFPSDWPFEVEYTDRQTLNLDSAISGLNPGASGAAAAANQSQWLLLNAPSLGTHCFQIKSASESNPGLYAVSTKTSQLVLVTPPSTSIDATLRSFVGQTRSTTVYVQSQLLTFCDLPLTATTLSTSYPYSLATGMILPTWGGSITLCGLQPIADLAPIGVSAKRVRIASTVALTGSRSSGSSNGGFTPTGATGALAASLNQPFLVDAFPPVSDPSITGNLLWQVLSTSGQSGALSVPSASVQLLPSASADPTAAEAGVVTVSTVNGATTALSLYSPLQRLYDTPTLRVNANAVAASHGETMLEVVGSGDATNAALQFQLKQSPLTYTSASNTSGVQSTLQVRINNLLWNEVPNFLSSAPADRVYVTRPSSTGRPFIQFGDGVHGSRTPTGTSNIQAQYRKGIGIAGMVAAGQLTQPLDRPQGLQNVTNPAAATGGADPATPLDAQQSAPLPTLTLGRVVSLEDYQNFALSFPGISMALATWTTFGTRIGVFLTVAGEGGTQLSADDQVVLNLLQAYQTYGLPNVPVRAVSYVPQNFEIGLQVLVNVPTYDPTLVIPQVWQALTAAFAFGQLAPGQSVIASQVIEIAQQIPGVIAVNLTALNKSGAAGVPANILCASGPIPGNASGTVPSSGAQVLRLDPASVGNVGLWS